MTTKIIDFPTDEYTDYVIKKYDLQIKGGYVLNTPEVIGLEKLKKSEWNILCILGASGSGKSTILKQFGEEVCPKYDFSKSIVSQFPNSSPSNVCEVFYSIGLSSVPLWLHKPNELSNGEKARLEIAWQLLNNPNDLILIDEFTSVVNRMTAKSMSYNLQKYIRRKQKKIILCSCHYDIIQWLQPDFIINLNKKINGNVLVENVEYADEYPMIDARKLLTDGVKI